MESTKILLVEDNLDDIELVQLALETGNIANKLMVVRDGEEALDYIFCTGTYKNRDCNDLPALILLDLNLPKINGFEVLKEIRTNEKTQFIPVTVSPHRGRKKTF